MIRCEKCGEEYSVTYKRCPFCDERPSRGSSAEEKYLSIALAGMVAALTK